MVQCGVVAAWAVLVAGGWGLATALLVAGAVNGFDWFGRVAGSVITEAPGTRAWMRATSRLAGGGDLMHLPAGRRPGARPGARCPSRRARDPLRTLELSGRHRRPRRRHHRRQRRRPHHGPDELVLLLGQVGSGKSSLLGAAGRAGHQHRRDPVERRARRTTRRPFLRPGRVAHVAQVPRVLSGTFTAQRAARPRRPRGPARRSRPPGMARDVEARRRPRRAGRAPRRPAVRRSGAAARAGPGPGLRRRAAAGRRRLLGARRRHRDRAVDGAARAGRDGRRRDLQARGAGAGRPGRGAGRGPGGRGRAVGASWPPAGVTWPAEPDPETGPGTGPEPGPRTGPGRPAAPPPPATCPRPGPARRSASTARPAAAGAVRRDPTATARATRSVTRSTTRASRVHPHPRGQQLHPQPAHPQPARGPGVAAWPRRAGPPRSRARRAPAAPRGRRTPTPRARRASHARSRARADSSAAPRSRVAAGTGVAARGPRSPAAIRGVLPPASRCPPRRRPRTARRGRGRPGAGGAASPLLPIAEPDPVGRSPQGNRRQSAGQSPGRRAGRSRTLAGSERAARGVGSSA